jgi:hypothetical protein
MAGLLHRNSLATVAGWCHAVAPAIRDGGDAALAFEWSFTQRPGLCLLTHPSGAQILIANDDDRSLYPPDSTMLRVYLTEDAPWLTLV